METSARGGRAAEFWPCRGQRAEVSGGRVWFGFAGWEANAADAVRGAERTLWEYQERAGQLRQGMWAWHEGWG